MLVQYDEYKTQVLTYGRRLAEKGYIVGTSGNVSMAIEGEDAIAITPSSKDYMQLTVDDICIVDYNLKQLDGPYRPSIETGMHLAFYRERKDVNAVIHTHQVYASIFSLLNEPIPALFDEAAMYIGNVVDIVPYAISGSLDLARNVTDKLKNQCNCYILQNHGAVVCGTSIETAFRNVEVLERVAHVYYNTLALGKEATKLPELVVNLLFQSLQGEQKKECKRKEAFRHSESQ